MTIQTIYLLGTAAVTPNFWGNTQLNGSAPTAANSAFGWTPAKTATSTPYYRGRLGATGSSGTAAQAASYNASTSGPTPGTGSSTTTAGDSFVAGPFSGTFAATAWTFNFNLRAGTNGCVGHVNMRVWKSASANGSTPTQLLANTAGASVTPSTGSDANSSISWSPGVLTLNNEYLFFQVEWQETTAGTSNSDNVLFRVGTASITTPDLEVTQTLAPTAIYNDSVNDSAFVAAAAPGLVTLLPALLNDVTTFAAYVPAVVNSNALNVAALYNDAANDAAYAPAATVTGAPARIQPDLFGDVEGIFVPVEVITAFLFPALVASDDVSAASALVSSTSLQPTTLAEPEQAYSAALVSSLSLTPQLVGDDSSAYTPAAAVGAVTLGTSLVASDDGTLVPVLSGLFTLSAGLPAAPDDAIPAPTAALTSQFLAPAFFADPFEAVPPDGVVLSGDVLPALYVEGETFPAATAAAGAATLAPAAFNSADTIFTGPGHMVSTSVLIVPLVAADDDEFLATISGQGAVMLWTGFEFDASTVYAPELLVGDAPPLQAPSVVDADAVLLPAVVVMGGAVANIGAPLYHDLDQMPRPMVLGDVEGDVALKPACVFAFDKFTHDKIVGGSQTILKPPFSGSVTAPAYMFGSVKSNKLTGTMTNKAAA